MVCFLATRRRLEHQRPDLPRRRAARSSLLNHPLADAHDLQARHVDAGRAGRSWCRDRSWPGIPNPAPPPPDLDDPGRPAAARSRRPTAKEGERQWQTDSRAGPQSSRAPAAASAAASRMLLAARRRERRRQRPRRERRRLRPRRRPGGAGRRARSSDKGGNAVANFDTVATVEGGENMIKTGARQLRPHRHPDQRRRHPARPHDLQHERAGVGRRHRRPPQGPLQHDQARLDPHAPAALRPHHQLLVDLRPARQLGAGELRRREGRHRRASRASSPATSAATA